MWIYMHGAHGGLLKAKPLCAHTHARARAHREREREREMDGAAGSSICRAIRGGTGQQTDGWALRRRACIAVADG
jgi:hypothetical protein